MRYLILAEVLDIHRLIIEQSGGSAGVRDLALLESAIAQPQISFGGYDLYPTLSEKAAALCYSIIQNHPFIDGNKRVGHAAMEVFLIFNGLEIQASIDEQEYLILGVASSNISREQLVRWLNKHAVKINNI